MPQMEIVKDTAPTQKNDISHLRVNIPTNGQAHSDPAWTSTAVLKGF